MAQGIYQSLINTEYTDKVVAFVNGRLNTETQAQKVKSKIVNNEGVNK